MKPQPGSLKTFVLNDEWEVFTLKLSVFQPFNQDNFDMKVEGSRQEIDGQTMKKNLLPIDYLPEKYGTKVKPYELSIKLKQGGENKIEYFYSLKSFEKETTVTEREPFRLLDIQDPFTYRGELSYNKSSV